MLWAEPKNTNRLNKEPLITFTDIFEQKTILENLKYPLRGQIQIFWTLLTLYKRGPVIREWLWPSLLTSPFENASFLVDQPISSPTASLKHKDILTLFWHSVVECWSVWHSQTSQHSQEEVRNGNPVLLWWEFYLCITEKSSKGNTDFFICTVFHITTGGNDCRMAICRFTNASAQGIFIMQRMRDLPNIYTITDAYVSNKREWFTSYDCSVNVTLSALQICPSSVIIKGRNGCMLLVLAAF